MKHSLKNPQKKTSCYVSYIDKPLKIGLNEIKINKFFNNGYKIECHLPPKINDHSISIIEELDNIKYTLKEGWELDVKISVKEKKIEMEVYEASKK